MSDLETLKKENEQLKLQQQQNNQGIHNLIAQLDAYKGELNDSRVISLQLRTNLISAQKVNQQAIEQLNDTKKQLDEALQKIKTYEDSKSAEVQPEILSE